MNNFSAIFRSGQVFISRNLQQSDITYGEQAILMYLAMENDCNQDNIARYFFIDKGAVAKTLQRLEQKQLIVREINPDNQREKRIHLSDQGRAHIEEMRAVRTTWQKCLYDGLTSQEIAEFERIAAKIEQNAIRHLK